MKPVADSLASLTRALILTGVSAGCVFACDFGPGARVEAALMDADRNIALSGSTIDPALDRLDLKVLAQKIAACREREQWRVVKFNVYASEESRSRTLSPDKNLNTDFSAWKRAYESEKPAPAVSALGYGGRVVVRRVYNGTVDHVEIEMPQTPTSDVPHPAEIPADILDIAIVASTETEPDAAATPGYVTFFVRAAAGSLTQSSGISPAIERFAADVASGLASMFVQVKIRNDLWFIDDPVFPVSYPFDVPRLRAPAQRSAGPEADCVKASGAAMQIKMSCRLVSPK